MSSSFIHYRGHGFWSSDTFTQVVAGEVAESLLARGDGNDWHSQMGEKWRIQATNYFMGSMLLELDEFITTEQRRNELREIIGEIMARRPTADPIGQTAELLVRLLNGEISWNASSPLDYMIDGRGRGQEPAELSDSLVFKQNTEDKKNA